MAKNLILQSQQQRFIRSHVTSLLPNMGLAACAPRGEMYCYWHGAIDTDQKKEAIKDHWRDL